MKIAVNTRLLLPDRLDGIGRFTYETLIRITRNHPEHEFYFLFDRPYDKNYIFSENVVPVVLPPQARHPLLFLTWFEISIPIALKKIKPDLFLSPDGYLSLRLKVPSIAVIHDLNFEHHPEDLPRYIAYYYRTMFPRFARKAERIATVSEFSKNDIIEQYKINANKIDVVYNGSSKIFKPTLEEKKTEIRDKFTGGCPYFIFVGSVTKRKNLINLFKAFDAFKSIDNQNYKLLLAGTNMYWDHESRIAYENLMHKEHVIRLGRVTDEVLVNLIGSATSLLLVSNFEGFGIPIIEAFNCDTPVIVSDVTSLPEVAGDAALFIQPHSIESITNALIRVSSDDFLRKSLIIAGRKQKNLFSWDSTAENLWNCIMNLKQNIR